MRNMYHFNLSGQSSLPHNPLYLSECCCWTWANWIMPLPSRPGGEWVCECVCGGGCVLLLILANLWIFEQRELTAHKHTHTHTHTHRSPVFLQFLNTSPVQPSEALCCQLSAQAGGLQPPLTPSAAPGSLFHRTVAWVCNTEHCAWFDLLLLSYYSQHDTTHSS